MSIHSLTLLLILTASENIEQNLNVFPLSRGDQIYITSEISEYLSGIWWSMEVIFLCHFCVKNPLPLRLYMEEMVVPNWTLGGCGHHWYYELLSYMILDLCAKYFCSLAWLKEYQKPLSLKDIHGGHWWSLARYFEDGVIIVIRECVHMSFLTYVLNVSYLG